MEQRDVITGLSPQVQGSLSYRLKLGQSMSEPGVLDYTQDQKDAGPSTRIRPRLLAHTPSKTNHELRVT